VTTVLLILAAWTLVGTAVALVLGPWIARNQ